MCAITQLWPSFLWQNTNISEYQLMCAEYNGFILIFSVRRSQWIMSAIFCVQNTDNSLRHVVCEEHRHFSLSFCLRRTQIILTVMLCVNNIDNLTVMLCVKNTDNSLRHVVCEEHKQNTDNSHCHFVRAEHSWAVTWTRPSAVPTTPCGNCSSRTERGTSTVCDTAAYWSVGTDPSRLVWHQAGQGLTQWGTAHHTPTADRSKRAKLLLSPSSLSCSLCPAFFLSVFFVLSFVLPFCLFVPSFLLPFSLPCCLCLAFFVLVFFVLPVVPSSFLSSFFSVPSCSVLKGNNLIRTLLSGPLLCALYN